jgi:hypothetical protein
MRAINHALTGAAIGVLIGEPVIAVPLAFVSHYVCDVIPHHGRQQPETEELNSTSFRVLLLADFCLCVLLVLILTLQRPHYWVLAAICAFVAASPDLFSINRYRNARHGKPPKLNPYLRFASGIQWFERPLGAVVEIVWFIAMLIILVPILLHR